MTECDEVHLALGTVQFGISYGVAGRGEVVPEIEVQQILQRAAELGIRVLDTASAYGDIEARLARLAGPHEFSIVSKLPSLPEDLSELEVISAVCTALESSRQRLGPLLRAVLFHRAEDLLGKYAASVWQVCEDFAAKYGIRMGVSCYDPETLENILNRFPIAIAQLPGNAFDQRLRQSANLSNAQVEIHLRSAFLQGLLLMDEAAAAQRVPAAGEALKRWQSWCRDHGYSKLQAALGVAKGLPGVRQCVVGVDRLEQLEEIALAWRTVPKITATALQTEDMAIIDPRRWNLNQ